MKKSRGAPPEPDLPPAPTPDVPLRRTRANTLETSPTIDRATEISGDGPVFKAGGLGYGTGFVTASDVAKLREYDDLRHYVKEVILLPFAYGITWNTEEAIEDPQLLGMAAQRAARWAWNEVERVILEEYGRRTKSLPPFGTSFKGLPVQPVQTWQGIEKGRPLLLLHPDDFVEYVRTWAL